MLACGSCISVRFPMPFIEHQALILISDMFLVQSILSSCPDMVLDLLSGTLQSLLCTVTL
jgi:hypothetical protein